MGQIHFTQVRCQIWILETPMASNIVRILSRCFFMLHGRQSSIYSRTSNPTHTRSWALLRSDQTVRPFAHSVGVLLLLTIQHAPGNVRCQPCMLASIGKGRGNIARTKSLRAFDAERDSTYLRCFQTTPCILSWEVGRTVVVAAHIGGAAGVVVTDLVTATIQGVVNL